MPQDYAFTQGSALATSSFQKGKTVLVLDCTRHGKKTRNHRKIAHEDRVRVGNKVLFEDCKHRLCLKLGEGRWQLVVSNDQHSHKLAIDPFSLRQHQWRDPGRLNALSQAQSLRAAGIQYRPALRALNIQGLRLSKDDYYNLSRSEGAHTEEEACQFALGVTYFTEHPPIRNRQIYINFEKSYSYNHALSNHQSGWKLTVFNCSPYNVITCTLKK